MWYGSCTVRGNNALTFHYNVVYLYTYLTNTGNKPVWVKFII